MSEPLKPEGPQPRPAKHRKIWIAALVALVGVGVIAWFHFAGTASARVTKSEKGKGKGKSGDGEAAIPVVATRARSGNIPVYFNGLGTVTPIYTVTLKSRVDGQLMNVMYKEGDFVKKGDLLIEIDPRPFQVQLEQAEAQQAKDQAALDNARTDQTRYETLLKQNAIPEQQVATQKATVAQDLATVKVDQAQIDESKLNLVYTKITAPISGRVGLRLVDPGNIVHASDATGLLVITQMDPISVLFTVAEDQLPVVLQKMKGTTLQVGAFDRDLKKQLARGVLSTVDNQIDQTTGTVRLRATFDNKDGVLFPNQFVNARLLVEEKRGVVLIPSAAIQRNTNTSFVYLVGADNKVTVRNIQIGTTEGDDSEITQGLKPGDMVVLTGVDKLQEGSEVNPQVQGDRSGKSKGSKQ